MSRRVSLPAVVALALIVGPVLALSTGCSTHKQLRSNALEFLYPKGAAAEPAQEVRLQLPVRVGVAFAPPGATWQDTFSEVQKRALLGKIAEAFRLREGIASVDAIPSSHVTPGGGFENLDRIRSAFGIDLIALVSYDQIQFSESGRSSIWYWTIVGAYLVKGEKNQTRTVMDAVVYDIPSRSMLFNASGQSTGAGSSTPVDMDKTLRAEQERGFDAATADLIQNLDVALAAFQEQAKTGTVRGQGTPALAIVDEQGRVVSGGAGGVSAGALGPLEALAGTALAALGAMGWRRRKLAGR